MVVSDKQGDAKMDKRNEKMRSSSNRQREIKASNTADAQSQLETAENVNKFE